MSRLDSCQHDAMVAQKSEVPTEAGVAKAYRLNNAALIFSVEQSNNRLHQRIVQMHGIPFRKMLIRVYFEWAGWNIRRC